MARPDHYLAAPLARDGTYSVNPAAPTITGITQGTGTALVVAFTKPTTIKAYSALALRYRITGTLTWTEYTLVGSTTSPYTLPGTTLASATTYDVEVATKAVNWSPWSVTVTGLTGSGADVIAPTVPGVPAITNIATSSITATWAASTDNFGVVTYELQTAPDVAGSPGSWAAAAPSSVAAPAVSTTVTGFAPSTSYWFRVRAVDAALNASAYATTAALFTTSALGAGYPSGPDFFVAPDNATPPGLSGNTGLDAAHPWSLVSLATTHAAAIAGKKVGLASGQYIVPGDILGNNGAWVTIAASSSGSSGTPTKLFSINPGGAVFTDDVTNHPNNPAFFFRSSADWMQFWGLDFRDTGLRAIEQTGDNSLIQRCQFRNMHEWLMAKRVFNVTLTGGASQTVTGQVGDFTATKGWNAAVSVAAGATRVRFYQSPNNNRNSQFFVTAISGDGSTLTVTSTTRSEGGGWPAAAMVTDATAGIEARSVFIHGNNHAVCHTGGGAGTLSTHHTIRDCYVYSAQPSDDDNSPDSPGSLAATDRQGWTALNGNFFGGSDITMENNVCQRVSRLIYPKANDGTYTLRNNTTIETFLGIGTLCQYGQANKTIGPSMIENNLTIDCPVIDPGQGTNGVQNQQATTFRNNTFALNLASVQATSGAWTWRIGVTAPQTGGTRETDGLGLWRFYNNLVVLYAGGLSASTWIHRFTAGNGHNPNHFAELRPDGTPWWDYNHYEQPKFSDVANNGSADLSTAAGGGNGGGSILRMHPADRDTQSGAAATGNLGPDFQGGTNKDWFQYTGMEEHSARGTPGIKRTAGTGTPTKDQVNFYEIAAGGNLVNAGRDDGTTTGNLCNIGCDITLLGLSFVPAP